MSEYDEELDELWDKGRELCEHVNTLIQSIGTLFQQEEYEKAIKVFGINFKANCYVAGKQAVKARLGSVMSILDMKDAEHMEDFEAEQKRRSEEFDK